MGIYDRDYQRGYNAPGYQLGAPTMMTTKLIIVTAIVYVAQFLTRDNGNWVTTNFSLYGEWYRQPWQFYRLLTYGFLHDPGDIKHIIFNMLGLFFLGRDVEYRYGSREYLAFYLTAIVIAGLVWTISEIPAGANGYLLGASGGVVAVVILFAFNFPHRTILFMFFLPMPMWVFALIVVVMDAFGAVQRSGNVAFTAHLGGAMFAFLYYQSGWRLERFLPASDLWKRLKPKPKLRVVDPDQNDESTDAQVDAILKKIQEHGRDSLSRQERRILEEASQKYQRRRRRP